MSRTWLSVRVELVEGRGEDYWPRPGRIFAAARTHTFGQLATAIDDAFARWDRAHLHQFWMADGPRIGQPDIEEDFDDDMLDEHRLTLGRLEPGEQFAYEFDFGDSWTHLCTVAERRIDPLETLRIVPGVPLPYWGWGDIPDQYGRRWTATTARASVRPTRRARTCPSSAMAVATAAMNPPGETTRSVAPGNTPHQATLWRDWTGKRTGLTGTRPAPRISG